MPVDTSTVEVDPRIPRSEFLHRGDLIRLGGAPYLHTLIATVPTAANAAYYAEIVAEKAILRRLVQAGTHIVQLGYHGAASALQDVWIALRANERLILETVTIEDVVTGELPDRVRDLVADPRAWV